MKRIIYMLSIVGASFAPAEFIQTRSGNIVEGVILRSSGDLMEVERPDGTIRRYHKKDIKFIFFGSPEELMNEHAPGADPEPEPVMQGEPKTLKMSSSWDMPIPSADPAVLANFKKLLAPYAQSEPRRTYTEFPEIAMGIPFMTTRREIESRHPFMFLAEAVIMSPAFPDRSFKYYKYRGDFDDGYNELLLITDLAEQVVAVQFVNESPAPDEELPVDYTDMWNYYNFVQMRKTSGSKSQAGFRVEDQGHVLCIHSGMRQIERERYGGYAHRLREKVRLYIPKSFASLLLHHLENQP